MFGSHHVSDKVWLSMCVTESERQRVTERTRVCDCERQWVDSGMVSPLSSHHHFPSLARLSCTQPETIHRIAGGTGLGAWALLQCNSACISAPNVAANQAIGWLPSSLRVRWASHVLHVTREDHGAVEGRKRAPPVQWHWNSKTLFVVSLSLYWIKSKLRRTKE